ncbi:MULTISPECIES: hypothetical protein [unclassified Breznakia]|uniref:hypothetical protein n=1 Tax=unclassified Breznakia TaxID=2623764 RepID=UPI0024766CEA|nr:MULTISPECIES: hypothetical protein [unclassified Breznakia]MDH6367386.1 hypothetical protein [Breznakia sp. PH1-1]MDH6403918.1 hypothetical protein [Breznakia sp. PF1-11]MDH6411627.1 hypothetical protein [Breznakia sp. PFB1-11]MDH6414553.1 hypothetical protein [Breznakia sp. PFB1-14]MDH6418659.1 hypothetical protein [Breznakia sp. PFB1-12]
MKWSNLLHSFKSKKNKDFKKIDEVQVRPVIPNYIGTHMDLLSTFMSFYDGANFQRVSGYLSQKELSDFDVASIVWHLVNEMGDMYQEITLFREKFNMKMDEKLKRHLVEIEK